MAFLFLVLFASSFSVNAQVPVAVQGPCPDFLSRYREGAPECPASGLVPETNPVGAIVVSDSGYSNSRSKFTAGGIEPGFTADVVVATLMGAGERTPLIILPVTDETMNTIRVRVNQLRVTRETRQRFMQALRQVPTPGYTWQQDYMQAVVDPRTGQIAFREVVGYSQGQRLKREVFNPQLTNEFNQCGIRVGDPLIPQEGIRGGHMGGNIEALPGGICLLGRDTLSRTQWSNYMRQVCRTSAPDTRIEVPTDWLQVGHTDEILKTVRNNNRPPPCNFSVAVASPDKGVELLLRRPNEPFMSFPNPRGGTPRETAARRVSSYEGLMEICDKVMTLRNGGGPLPSPAPQQGPTPEPSGSGRGVSLNFNLQMLLLGSNAVASDSPPDRSQCTNMTNREVAQVLTQDPDLSRLNNIIQERMNGLKRDITEKISRRIPGCTPDFLEMPDVFFGASPVRQANGTYTLPTDPGRILSVLPNPTNAISVNDTVISPEPGNSAFKDYIVQEYEGRKLTPRFVDTFDYAHMGSGNLHCSTNTVHLCSPRKAR